MEFKDYMNFERGLKEGDTVEIRWTWNGGHFSSSAKVVRVNGKSIRCEILESVYSGYDNHTWQPGHCFTAPKFFSNSWSNGNGVFPL